MMHECRVYRPDPDGELELVRVVSAKQLMDRIWLESASPMGRLGLPVGKKSTPSFCVICNDPVVVKNAKTCSPPCREKLRKSKHKAWLDRKRRRRLNGNLPGTTGKIIKNFTDDLGTPATED